MEASTVYILVGLVAVLLVVLAVVLRGRGGPHYERLSTEQLAAIAEELAEHYRARHRQSTGKELDYSRGSLSEIDRVLEKNFAQNSLEEKTVQEMGMYLGETLRREVGGYWRYNEGFQELCIELSEEGFIFPVSQIRRALEHKEAGSITSYVESIVERHAQAAS